MTPRSLIAHMKRGIPNVIPTVLGTKEFALDEKETALSDISVLIGVTGQLKGNIVIHSTAQSFRQIPLSMGMDLDDEMLLSFISELGNMLSGSFASSLSEDGVIVDISPPNLIKGNCSMVGYQDSVALEVQFNDGSLHILMNLKEEKE